MRRWREPLRWAVEVAGVGLVAFGAWQVAPLPALLIVGVYLIVVANQGEPGAGA